VGPWPWREQENNFKAVLESIRDLMNEATVVPGWLHDIFLGYGDPAAAQYASMEGFLATVDFKARALLPPSANRPRSLSMPAHPREHNLQRFKDLH
jgi:Intron-binding protein aquarius N-terminus